MQEIGGRRDIAKMHGSVDPTRRHLWAKKPVISRSDYEEYEDKWPRTWALLRATYMTRVMLFLGFSFTDPNIDLLLRLARRSRTAHRDRHLTVLKTPSNSEDLLRHRLRVVDLERSGIQTCEIEDFDQLAPLLAQLVRRTRPAQLFISGSGDEGEMKAAMITLKATLVTGSLDPIFFQCATGKPVKASRSSAASQSVDSTAGK